MSPWSITVFALMLAGAAVAAWRPGPEPDSEPAAEPGGRAEHVLIGFFHFFGIGRLPLALALAVLLATSVVAGLALEIIAMLHLGNAYPAWLPLDTVPSGLAVGLLSTRMLAASFPDD